MTTELQGLLERIAKLLDASGVPYMIAGSFASIAHGVPRTTHDVDIVIDPPNGAALDALVKSMAPDAYYVDADTAREALRQRTMFNVVDQMSGWKIDFVVRKNRPFSRDEFARRMKLTLLDVPVFVASPEDTIIAKLEWSKQAGGSERQRRDVAGIVASIANDLDRGYIDRWIRDLDLADEWRAAQQTAP
jgi:hypothetical protein